MVKLFLPSDAVVGWSAVVEDIQTISVTGVILSTGTFLYKEVLGNFTERVKLKFLPDYILRPDQGVVWTNCARMTELQSSLKFVEPMISADETD